MSKRFSDSLTPGLAVTTVIYCLPLQNMGLGEMSDFGNGHSVSAGKTGHEAGQVSQ